MSGGSRLLVVGQGHVGLPLAAAAVAAGHEVTGYDVEGKGMRSLAVGRSLVEDVAPPVREPNLTSCKVRASEELAPGESFDVAIITVAMPKASGPPGSSPIKSAAATLASQTRGPQLVLEALTYPGATEDLVVLVLEAGDGPVVGPDAFTGLFDKVDIALVDEVAVLTEPVEEDVWKGTDPLAAEAIGFSSRVPAPGPRRHCLPIDPRYLSWMVRQRLGRSFRFVGLVNHIDDDKADPVELRLMRAVNVRGPTWPRDKVLVLGLVTKRPSSRGAPCRGGDRPGGPQ